MRVALLVFSLIALACVASGQELSRRERLRKLITAAREGDLDARQALRDLRDKLKSRSDTAHFQEQPAQQPRVVEPEPVPQRFPRIHEPQPIQQRFQPQPQQPSRRQKARPQFQHEGEIQQRVGSFRQPHRAINRGLEVDSRSEAHANIRVTNQTKTPPIETIKRYSYFDEEGNYIFGYEAADGSFKEEKRGKDCIVHGKYGYVDPTGIKREFNYVSGNKCDPNAPSDPELAANQPALPKNDQFLIQTQERQLSQDALNELHRPRPIQQNQPVFQQPRKQQQVFQQPRKQQQQPVFQQPRKQQQQPVFQQPRKQQQQPVFQQPRRQQQQQQPQIVRQPQRGRRIQSHRRPNTIESVVRDEPIQVQPEAVVEQTPEEPAPAPQPQEDPAPEILPDIQHFKPAQHNPKPQVAFRPRPKPVDFDFNFDSEFKQIFDKFAHPVPQSRPFVRPISAPRTPAPPISRPPPPPKPISSPVPKKAISPKIEKPASKPKISAAPFPSKIDDAHHQLVFDSASGTFKTVPLGSSGPSFISAPRSPPPPPPPAPAAPSSFGRPLPLPGFSPLPSVPLGSLSFGGSNDGNFNNFFKDFTVTRI